MKNFLISLVAIAALWLIPYFAANVAVLKLLIAVIIPYAAVVIFLVGFIYKVIDWSKSAVPFRIPTTAGQQKSLPWIKANNIDNPFTKMGVIIRMLLEVLAFRSLFRNTTMSVSETEHGKRLAYKTEIFLWIGAMAFHYCFLVVVLRHLRFFLDPVPACVQLVEFFDGLMRVEFFSSVFSIGLPGIMMSGLILLAAAIFLLGRRLFNAKVKYISLMADYFPLQLIIAIAISGIFMRHFFKVDLTAVKQLSMGLATFSPVIPTNVGSIFYIHIFLVSMLVMYIPFSKLMHMAGVFLSPTRNLTADTRMNRHINPWNHDVKTHNYDEYEDEFREVMKNAGLRVEKE
ncbi:MAG: sulfate reduction electron transfer complex DsrMKJOP subunit DsrM [Fibrobacteria bacterium]|nr:sulfate reduction electron transfer complex DsrMKJOP subunit DsrM [Fibrobacteria bacterium]